MRDTFTMPPADMTSDELVEEVKRIDFLWEMHLDQLRKGNSNEFRDRSMGENKRRKEAILSEIERRS